MAALTRFVLGTGLPCLLATFATPASAAPALVIDTTIAVVSSDGSDTLVARRLILPARVRAAAYDSAGRVLLISYEGERYPGSGITEETMGPPSLLAYDLGNRRVLWKRKDRALPYGVIRGRGVLVEKNDADVVDLADGKNLVHVNDDWYLDHADGLVVKATDRSITAYDVATGEIRWDADRQGVTGEARFLRPRDVLLVAADGLQALRIATGEGWSYPLPASRARVFALAGEQGFVRVPTLGSLLGLGGRQVESMNGLPVVEGGRVYFAAETTVVCLGLETGQLLWRRELRRDRRFSLMRRAMGLPSANEFLGNLLLRSSGGTLTVASLGWASGAKANWIADKPTIALLAKEDGHVIRRVRVEGVEYLIDVRSTPRGHFLLAPDRIVLMDDSLRVVHTFRSTASVSLTSFFPCEDPIVVVAADGIEAFGPDSLRQIWQRKIGSVGAVWPGWGRPGADGYRWTISTAGLNAFDLRGGCQAVRSYPLQGVASDIQDGAALVYSGRSLVLLPIPIRGAR